MVDIDKKCTSCSATGYPPSEMINRCEFCGGTEGGNPPSKGDVISWNNNLEVKKFCVNCKWSVKDDSRLYKCREPRHNYRDMVTGEPRIYDVECSRARAAVSKIGCGPFARNFVVKGDATPDHID